jgi:predicted nucleic acid-binding protein
LRSALALGQLWASPTRELMSRLRKVGVTVRKTIDIIIATFCIIEGLTLLHHDRDFDPTASHFPLETFVPR